MDFNEYVKWRHKTRRAKKMEESMMGRASKNPDTILTDKREYHSMKCFVDTVRQVLPEEENEHTHHRG